jgi:hypothetical protein
VTTALERLTSDVQKSIAEKNAFVFSLAESDEKSDPKSFGKWQKNSAANNEQTTDPESEDGDSKDEKPEDPETPQDPIDFTIIMEDTLGEKIVFPLSQFSALQRNIQVRIWKSQFITGENESENIFQTFHFPLSEIQPYNPNLDFTHLQSVTFKFDKTPKGVVIVDNLGFM